MGHTNRLDECAVKLLNYYLDADSGWRWGEHIEIIEIIKNNDGFVGLSLKFPVNRVDLRTRFPELPFSVLKHETGQTHSMIFDYFPI